MELNERIVLTVHALAFGGEGVARTPEGFVFFIPFGVPGDELEVEITELKKKFARGRIVEVIKPSSHRREAPCPVFGICGGCQWQHMTYASQVQFKFEIIQSALKKASLPVESLSAVIASPREFHYRNRIQIRAQNGNIGFYQRGTHKIVSIDKCWIALPELNDAFNSLPREPDRKIELQVNRSGGVQIDENAGHGENLGFSQVNEFGNQLMIAAVLDHVRLWNTLHKISTVWDLYSGDGNFTWPLAERFESAHIHAVEWNRVSVDRGNSFAQERGLDSRLRFHSAKVEEWLKLQIRNSGKVRPDVVLLDPPRMGVDPKSLQAILKLNPEFVIYIGCDLSHFIRDVKPLLEKYEMEKMVPVDLFPQTFHVEMIAFLRALKH